MRINRRGLRCYFHAGWSSGTATGKIAGDYRSWEEAVASYNKLFNGAPPEGDMLSSTGVRWRKFRLAVAKRLSVKTHQCGCTGQYGPAKQSGLLLFSSDRRDEGFAVLEQMGNRTPGAKGPLKSGTGRLKTARQRCQRAGAEKISFDL